MARVLTVLLLLLAGLTLPAAASAAPDNADLSVVLDDSPDPVDAGGQLSYSLTVTNAVGSGRTAAAVTLTDALPSGTTFVSMTQTSGPEFATPAFSGGIATASGGALPPGAVARFTLVVRVDPGTPSGTVLSDSAHVPSSPADPTMANNDDTETTDVTLHADLDVAKVAVATSGS